MVDGYTEMPSLLHDYDRQLFTVYHAYDNITKISYMDRPNASTVFDFSSYDFYSFCLQSLDELDRYAAHCVIFFVFTLFGLIGNITLLFVILSSKPFHSAPNVLIVNLSIGDLVYMLSTAPFNIRHELLACWLLGSIACKVKHYLPIVAQAACIFSLVSLSRERYNAIVKGFESRMKHRLIDRPVFTVSLSWVVGFVIGLPVLYFAETKTFGLICIYLPMADVNVKIYVVGLFCILYIIPFIIIAFHYTLLAKTLLHPGILTLMCNKSSMQQMKARRRLALTVLTITVLFGFCWLPYHVYHLWYMFTKYSSHISLNKTQTQIFRHFYNYMSLANSCLNPWIIFFMSSAHRKSIVNWLSKCRCFQKKLFQNKASWRVQSTSIQTMSRSWKTEIYHSHASTTPLTTLNEHVC